MKYFIKDLRVCAAYKFAEDFTKDRLLSYEKKKSSDKRHLAFIKLRIRKIL